MENTKSGFVSIIGRPNVGKSTLMNRIIGQKIAITSNKPQTTRNRIQTVYTDERGQLVFLDTPGIHKAKNKLGEYMVGAAEKTVDEVDVIMWLVEPDVHIGAGDEHIIERLGHARQPIILVINKLDTVKKEDILPVIGAYKDRLDFAEIVPISAYNGDGVDDLVEVLFKYMPYGPMFYDEETVTDQPMRQIVSELIREKALHALNDEVPHGIAVVIDRMKDRDDKEITDIDATIICERESHKGGMLKKIGTNARFEIERLLGHRANLKLFVKVKKEWRDSDYLLKNFGYDAKKDL
jgi:GTP-binding protein Era